MSLGYDCSPAATLRNLDFRTEALPFDWVVSDLQILIKCIDDNFDNYHKNLYFNNRRSRLIDSYGFQFPHDYPFDNNNIVIFHLLYYVEDIHLIILISLDHI